MEAVKKKLKKILSSRRGTSIVSVMAAFVLLLIGIAMFYTAILASQNMLQRAERMNLAVEQVLEIFYEEGYTGTQTGTDGQVITLREKNGTDELQIRAGHEQATIEVEPESGREGQSYPVTMYYFSD